MITVPELIKISGNSRATVYRDIKRGLVTKTSDGILEDDKLRKYLDREKFTRDTPGKVGSKVDLDGNPLPEPKPKERAKYTPPPPNQVTSLKREWEEKIKYVSDYDLQRDHDYEDIEQKFVNVLGRVLTAIQLINPEKHLTDKDLQRECRDWMKLAASAIKTNRDVEVKKESGKGSDNAMIFRQIRKDTMGEDDDNSE